MMIGLLMEQGNREGRPVGFWIVVCLISFLAVAGCSDRESRPEEVVEDEMADGRVVHTYVVRGRVTQLPDVNRPERELRIHHEAIDDFKNAAGELTPMAAMEMPFFPAEGVSLADIRAGDIVEFTFEVQWEPSSGVWVTDIRKLSPDTTLELGNAHHGGHGMGD